MRRFFPCESERKPWKKLKRRFAKPDTQKNTNDNNKRQKLL